MKLIAVLLFVVVVSCSKEEDPKPQISCQQLKQEIELAQKAVADHQAKGNGGNQASWEVELKRLNDIKTVKSNEYAKRYCL